MKRSSLTTPIIALLLLFLTSCSTKVETDNQHGSIQFQFEHRVDGKPIAFDGMIYTNAAGNQYLVNEIQYFISDIVLHKSNGGSILLDAWDDILYVDTDISGTWNYTFQDEIPPGGYNKISFTFGINELKNQSLMFVNPPQSFMFWPENLGGGYHYMKLNGKWVDTLDMVSPFNFHLGIGQIYHSYPDSITDYVHNHFNVDLPDSGFEIQAGQQFGFTIVMNVENWFISPNIYNHDDWGGDIMQKQEAMKLATENGWDVFRVEK